MNSPCRIPTTTPGRDHRWKRHHYPPKQQHPTFLLLLPSMPPLISLAYATTPSSTVRLHRPLLPLSASHCHCHCHCLLLLHRTGPTNHRTVARLTRLCYHSHCRCCQRPADPEGHFSNGSTSPVFSSIASNPTYSRLPSALAMQIVAGIAPVVLTPPPHTSSPPR